MTASLITKKIIASALKKLMEGESFHKISVSDVMKECNMRRQTFYYHFQDKFELLEWIYQEETKENITDFIEYEKWENIFSQLFYYFFQNQRFYRNALEVSEQNSLTHYLFDHIKNLYTKIIDEWILRNDIGISKQRKDVIASFYSYGFVGTVKTWIENSCNVKPEVMSKLMTEMVNAQMIISLQETTENWVNNNDKNNQPC